MRRRLLIAAGVGIAVSVGCVILAAAIPSEQTFLTATAGAIAAIAAVFAYFRAVASRAASDAVQIAESAEREARLDRRKQRLLAVARQIVQMEDAARRVLDGQPMYLFNEGQSALKASMIPTSDNLPTCTAHAECGDPKTAWPMTDDAQREIASAINALNLCRDKS